jgi:dTDP-L-rhamnose 4-epimerase
VHDVARACSLALSAGPPRRPGGERRQRREHHRQRDRLAAGRASSASRTSRPEVTGKFRVGDIRHCFADVSLARGGPRLRAAGPCSRA